MENPDLSLYGPSGGVGIGVGGGGGTSYFYGTGIGKQLNTDINYGKSMPYFLFNLHVHDFL